MPCCVVSLLCFVGASCLAVLCDDAVCCVVLGRKEAEGGNCGIQGIPPSSCQEQNSPRPGPRLLPVER